MVDYIVYRLEDVS